MQYVKISSAPPKTYPYANHICTLGYEDLLDLNNHLRSRTTSVRAIK